MIEPNSRVTNCKRVFSFHDLAKWREPRPWQNDYSDGSCAPGMFDHQMLEQQKTTFKTLDAISEGLPEPATFPVGFPLDHVVDDNGSKLRLTRATKSRGNMIEPCWC